MNNDKPDRVMHASEIPAFVNEVIAAGYDICAVGERNYVLNESDEIQSVDSILNRIVRKFGNRDFIQLEIATYLRSVGRYIDPSTEA